MKKDYFYIDINTKTKRMLGWGSTPHATHTGETDQKHVHRVFLTKGQFNKLMRKLP